MTDNLKDDYGKGQPVMTEPEIRESDRELADWFYSHANWRDTEMVERQRKSSFAQHIADHLAPSRRTLDVAEEALQRIERYMREMADYDHKLHCARSKGGCVATCVNFTAYAGMADQALALIRKAKENNDE
jgi:predicted ATP-dependent protease